MEIVYEDKDIIVVFKPAGIATQTAGVGQKDVVSELKNHLGGGFVGVVHRLDQPVEGLLVFAKNKKAAALLSAQVANKEDGGFLKEYDAVVFADRDFPEKAQLKDHIVKEKEGLARIIPNTEGDRTDTGKEARLSYVTIGDVRIKGEGEGSIYRLKVNLETGRFHQIRAQLAAHGLPIIGDIKYGSEKSIDLSKRLCIKRVLLCASRIRFKHPENGKVLEFTHDAFCGIINA